MSTKATEERLDEARRRIDALQARAKAGNADASDSIKGQVEELRREEAAARTALREAHEAKPAKPSQPVDVADDKLRQLQARLRSAEHALTAELAEDVTTFTDEVDASLDDLEQFFDLLNENAATKSGTAREQVEAAIGELRSGKDKLLARAEVRQSSGERWHEHKKHLDAARAELEHNIDDAIEKLE